MEEPLRGGHPEDVWAKLKWGVVLGSETFSHKVRKQAEVVRETQGRRALRDEVAWEEVVRAVEEVKGEKWNAFQGRYADEGRDLAFWVARRRAGMTLRQLGAQAEGMDYSAVSEAMRRSERKRLRPAEVKRPCGACFKC